MKRHYFSGLIFLIFLIGCASTQKNRDAHKELKNLISQHKYDKAIDLVKSERFYPEKRSRLLKLFELGSIYYLNNLDQQALETFKQAKELSDKLYTKSISKKIEASVSNENQDIYYGERYERSLLRYYMALIHLKIYLKGGYKKVVTSKQKDKRDKKVEFIKLNSQEKRQHLFAARAMILEWDSLLDQYKNKTAGEAFYKTDLLAKFLGGLIHEQVGTRTDRNIARQLYKDAKDVLFKYYNLLPSFNHKFDLFAKNYEDLPKMDKAKIKKKYVQPTYQSKSLLSYIDSRLQNLKKKKKDNVHILVNKGFINGKKAKNVDFPLPLVHIGVVNGRKTDLFHFTLEMLAISGGSRPTISFELPYVEQKENLEQYEVVVLNPSEKTIISSERLNLINPHSDLAWLSMKNKRKDLKDKVGLRVAMKHVSAILASYKIYEAQPNAMGKIAAGIAYAASNKAIAASELADLRYWASLADSVLLTSMYVDQPGQYKYQIRKLNSMKKKDKEQNFEILYESSFELKNDDLFIDLNLN